MIKILSYEGQTRKELFPERKAADVSAAVREILSAVKERGDDALREYAERFDGGVPARFEVSREEIEEAVQKVDPSFYEIIKEAAENIREFHRHQVREGFTLRYEDGRVLGQKVTPLQRVGLYVPGGTAAYPSTVLMDAIPAKLAGCPELVMTTPAKGGVISPEVLAAAKAAGVDRVFRVGGAQAIAALAYGSESIPKVDKIVGPGNAFVAEAKRQVFGIVSIDMIAGPSEILIIADEKSDPEVLAADLLSQAEHDKMASAVLITPSVTLAKSVAEATCRQLALLPRREIAEASVNGTSKILLVKDIQEAIELSNEIAPEHLELCLDDPFPYLDMVKNAGSVFLGRYCPEALGDYFAGPNHTLPTGGTAKFSSPLSVDDFVKKTQFTYFPKEALEKAAPKIAVFAEKEGLDAHGRSALCRFPSLIEKYK